MSGSLLTLRVVRAVEYINDARWNYPVNLYPHHTAYFVLAGDGHVQIGTKVVDLQPGFSYLLPANTMYSCWCTTHIRKLYVEFYLETTSGADVYLGQEHLLSHPCSDEQMRALLSSMNSQKIKDRLRFEGGLMCAIASLLSECAMMPRDDIARLGPVVKDMTAHLTAKLRVGDLARRHGWVPSSLSRAFQNAYSCSPKQFMARLLVNTLKRDLLLTDITLNELAVKYHFCDAYYLSNFFKRHMGLSPQHYRQELKEE